MIDFNLIEGVGAVIFIVAIIEILKRFSFNTKYSPIVAIVLGIGMSIAYLYVGGTELFEAVVQGFAVGLTAVGLFSGAKNSIEAFHK